MPHLYSNLSYEDLLNPFISTNNQPIPNSKKTIPLVLFKPFNAALPNPAIINRMTKIKFPPFSFLDVLTSLFTL